MIDVCTVKTSRTELCTHSRHLDSIVAVNLDKNLIILSLSLCLWCRRWMAPADRPHKTIRSATFGLIITNMQVASLLATLGREIVAIVWKSGAERYSVIQNTRKTLDQSNRKTLSLVRAPPPSPQTCQPQLWNMHSMRNGRLAFFN